MKGRGKLRKPLPNNVFKMASKVHFSSCTLASLEDFDLTGIKYIDYIHSPLLHQH